MRLLIWLLAPVGSLLVVGLALLARKVRRPRKRR